MKKISVIVPIYNVEKYLSKCIESIINQTYKAIELILVNDGSTDNSDEIAKQYEKFENVKYFKKANGGLSDARNFGLTKATGDYIAFVDSDDYLELDLFEKLSKYMEKDIEMIKYKLVKVDGDHNEIERFDGPVFDCKNGQEAFNSMFAIDTMLQPAWLYLYKKSFWDENKFEYPVRKNT